MNAVLAISENTAILKIQISLLDTSTPFTIEDTYALNDGGINTVVLFQPFSQLDCGFFPICEIDSYVTALCRKLLRNGCS
jgi:hypothetical protein